MGKIKTNNKFKHMERVLGKENGENLSVSRIKCSMGYFDHYKTADQEKIKLIDVKKEKLDRYNYSSRAGFNKSINDEFGNIFKRAIITEKSYMHIYAELLALRGHTGFHKFVIFSNKKNITDTIETLNIWWSYDKEELDIFKKFQEAVANCKKYGKCPDYEIHLYEHFSSKSPTWIVNKNLIKCLKE